MKKTEVAILGILVLGGLIGRFYFGHSADSAEHEACSDMLAHMPHAVESLSAESKSAICSRLKYERETWRSALARRKTELRNSLPRDLADDEAYIDRVAATDVMAAPTKYGAVPLYEGVQTCLENADGDARKLGQCADNAGQKTVPGDRGRPTSNH